MNTIADKATAASHRANREALDAAIKAERAECLAVRPLTRADVELFSKRLYCEPGGRLDHLCGCVEILIDQWGNRVDDLLAEMGLAIDLDADDDAAKNDPEEETIEEHEATEAAKLRVL